MPITFMFAPPRTGKSYEAVTRRILPALREGRRVVTNIPLNKAEFERMLKKEVDIHQISIRELNDPESYPWDPEGVFIPGKVIRPGDCLIIDELHVVFPSGEKIHARIASFMRLHGHFFDDKTGRPIDIMLITHDVQTVPREFKFLGELYISLKPRRKWGKGGAYKFHAYDSASMRMNTMLGKPAIHKINLKLCALYESFTHGKGGVVKSPDGRVRMLSKAQVFFFFVLPIPFLLHSANHWYNRFFVEEKKSVERSVKSVAAPAGASSAKDCYDGGVSIGGQWHKFGANGQLEPVDGAPGEGCGAPGQGQAVGVGFGGVAG